MPIFEIETIEQWEYDVSYRVGAPTAEEAVRKILPGDAEYGKHEIRERSPRQEVKQIVRVTNEDTSEVIESERKLKTAPSAIKKSKHSSRTPGCVTSHSIHTG